MSESRDNITGKDAVTLIFCCVILGLGFRLVWNLEIAAGSVSKNKPPLAVREGSELAGVQRTNPRRRMRTAKMSPHKLAPAKPVVY